MDAQNLELQELSDEQKALRRAQRYIDNEDFDFLNAVESDVKTLHQKLGMLEEQKIQLLQLIDVYRKKRAEKLKELELKYALPKNCKWHIDAKEKRIIFLDKEGKITEKPVVFEEKE